MIPEETQNKLPVITILFTKHKVKNAYAFGSVVSGDFRTDSDIDILVNLVEGIDPAEAGGHLWDLEDELRDLFKRKVDLITEQSLKNPYFIKEINNTKVRIYG